MERYRSQVHFQVILHETNVGHLRRRIPEFLPDVGRNDDSVDLLLASQVLFHPAHVAQDLP